jgi:hypothetical protein
VVLPTEPGVTVIACVVAPLDQRFPVAKLEVRVMLCPKQIVAGLGLEVMVTVGKFVTVTVTLAVFIHPFKSVPVTVYVLVTVGWAVTVVPDVESNPVAGDHV